MKSWIAGALLFIVFPGLNFLWSQESEALFTGDLDAIKKRGELRILVTATPELDEMTRRISPREYDRIFLSDIAENMNVVLKYVYVEKFSDLIPALRDGRGDIIADNISITGARKKLVDYTMPISSTQDQIVAAKSNRKVKSENDLANKNIYVEADTTYVGSFNWLKNKIPSLRMTSEKSCDTESLLYKVSSGEVELAIADTNYTLGYLSFRDDIKIVYTFPHKIFTGWAVRKNCPALLKTLNDYLSVYLPKYKDHILKGDLPELKKRKFIRVLTRNNPSCYYIQRGQFAGFEYELARKFAEEQKLYLIMIVPPKWDDMIPWLIEGKGDIAAALISKNTERLNMKEISFCAPYCENNDRIVGRISDRPFKSSASLKGRTVWVRRDSSYWEPLSELKASGINFTLKAAPETLETFEIIDKVAKGEYDLTVSNEHIFKLELMRRDDVKELFRFEKTERHHWLVRSEDVLLKKAVDQFFKREYRQTFFNVVYNRYFKYSKQAAAHSESYKGSDIRVCSYDPIIKEYSSKYDFNWLLVCAQICQESGFDHTKESYVGAIGLMQVMPATGREMGFKDIKNPTNNVHAGVKYLHKMRTRFPENLPDSEREFFSLASYNVGLGHVIDARRLAREMNLDPNRWFNNVETAIQLLSRPQYASRAKYGYCRGGEPVLYVRKIIQRYRAYKQDEANKCPGPIERIKLKPTN
ncbi:MAG: hypothetical protein A2020_01330 [Lentisphaerae bacterium GWF2_45_14]|nr:MAG: hypothetical protein A2020_01330 [Lentisphaerae bacterium GWF2_45_14]